MRGWEAMVRSDGWHKGNAETERERKWRENLGDGWSDGCSVSQYLMREKLSLGNVKVISR